MTLEVSSKLNVSVILSCSFNSLQFSLAVAADAAQGEMFPFHFAPVARAVVLLGEKKKKKVAKKSHFLQEKKKGTLVSAGYQRQWVAGFCRSFSIAPGTGCGSLG